MTFKITIANTGKTVRCGPKSTILAAAVKAGIDYPYACATGNCGVCVTALRSGEVTMMAYGDGALSKEQAEQGRILACRATPVADAEVMWLGRGRT